MSRKTTIPTQRGFGRTYWYLLAWIGWTCLVLGVSAMSMTGWPPGSVTSIDALWPMGPANPEAAAQYGRIDHAPLMASSAPAEPNPGPAAIANYER